MAHRFLGKAETLRVQHGIMVLIQGGHLQFLILKAQRVPIVLSLTMRGDGVQFRGILGKKRSLRMLEVLQEDMDIPSRLMLQKNIVLLIGSIGITSRPIK